jgi:hypothetical protein
LLTIPPSQNQQDLDAIPLPGGYTGSVFGRRPRLPISADQQKWVDDGFRRLSRMLGSSRMTGARVVLPTDEFFPDPWNPGPDGLHTLFRRVCGHMHVDPARVELELIPDHAQELIDQVPIWHGRSSGAAGVHLSGEQGELPVVAVRSSLLSDPLVVIATLAHELGHVILLGGGHIAREVVDMEPMTDLATVYLGLGVFTANACCRFEQHQDNYRQGWSTSTHGYLTEPIYGYALARFAKDRGEVDPPWAGYLDTNLRVYFRQSAAWLRHGEQPIG